MRQRSLVAPVVLILAGLVFLANNLRPEFSAWQALSRIWPYLLIGWGLLRLLEVTLGAARGRVLPVRGVSGGEWLLVVLVSVTGLGAQQFAYHRPPWLDAAVWHRGGIDIFGNTFDYSLQAEQSAIGAKRLLIENLRGDIRITGSDTEQIRVTGTKHINSIEQDEANRIDQETSLEIERRGDDLIVRTHQERAPGERRVRADLEITLPRNVSVQCRGRYGDYDLTSLHGAVDINSDNAGVRLQDIDGNVRLDIRRSDIVRAFNITGSVSLTGNGSEIEIENVEGQVTVEGTYSGDVQFRHINQPVQYRSRITDLRMAKLPGMLRLDGGDLIGSDIVGPIVLSARSKDVDLSNFTESLELRVDRGDVALRPGRAPLSRMDVQTRGDIDLDLPEKSAFALHGSTEKGEIVNDFGAAMSVSSTGRGSTITGSVGSGPDVRLTTDHGTLTIRRSTEDQMVIPPVPPAPPAPRRPSADL